ncbi:MAG: nucleotide sugar dehydrogenase [Gemmatimonadaceae bacterium]
MSTLIGVIGPGIVGMPMAALLARTEMAKGPAGARVLVVQRDSPTSGWKVPAINRGESPIGGVEPDLQTIVESTVAAGHLAATHDIKDLRDADAVLVCVQTDKSGMGPDYGPLFAALDALALVWRDRPKGLTPPLVAIESTLAPSSMSTVVRERFAAQGLVAERDVRLGNSPNRVMPGRLVARVAASDKLVGGLSRETAASIQRLYGGIVTGGTLHVTSSLTAEIVKTLENAYRDVRIAFAAEVARWCDAEDIDFFRLRDAVNALVHQEDAASGNATAVPSGALLVPTVGVGGHCLPKDGILLWWRRHSSDPGAAAASLILASRGINDASPAHVIARTETLAGSLSGARVAVLGAAYRFDSEDTRNSPSLVLASSLRARGALVTLHDPYVRSDDVNVRKYGLEGVFTNDLSGALAEATVLIAATGHGVYRDGLPGILEAAPAVTVLFDAANLWHRNDFQESSVRYDGIGRGRLAPDEGLVRFVRDAFVAVERGVANEVAGIADYLNSNHAPNLEEQAQMDQIRALAATCSTGCLIPEPGSVQVPEAWRGFLPTLTRMAPLAH